METKALKAKVKEIVEKAAALRDKHAGGENIPVNYACIFSQNKKEYGDLLKVARRIGEVVKETPTGPIFHIEPLDTVSGTLKLLKIRTPDPGRPELGDADFTVPDFLTFKKQYLSRKGFRLIKREGFDMIELMDPEFDVLVYFSNPPLDVQLGLKK